MAKPILSCMHCQNPPYITIRHHRQRLCRKHYIRWFQDKTDRTTQKYGMFDHKARILVAVSGGKDSLALWDALLRRGFAAEGLFIDLGIGAADGFSARSLAAIRLFLEKEHPAAPLHVVSLRESCGATLPELARGEARGRKKPCALCGLIKRHIMNEFPLKNGFTALATGHTLDDEAAILLRNVIHWECGYLGRQGPVLEESPGFIRRVKPFVRFFENEIAAYVRARNIVPVTLECPWSAKASTNRYKQLLARHEEEAPGASLHFYQQFLDARAGGRVVFPAQKAQQLAPCCSCGTPTNTGDSCAYCRMLERRAARGRRTARSDTPDP